MVEWIRVDLPVRRSVWYTPAALALYVSDDFSVQGWNTEPRVVAGPFDTLEAAKAALLMLSEKA